jgi:hypothetical protein
MVKRLTRSAPAVREPARRVRRRPDPEPVPSFIKRGQHANGAKLNDAAVIAIRAEYDGGRNAFATQAMLAEKYDVTQNTISLVVRGVTYKDVVVPAPREQ